MKPILLLTACAALALPGPAVFAQTSPLPGQARPQGEEGALTDAAEAPLRDLNIIHDKTPPVLQDAAAAPYAHVAPQDCDAMRHQIAELDLVLGPDLDDAHYDPKNGSLLADAVHGAIHVPFAGVVRRLSGAAKAKAEEDHAILAGYTRRAYLKGALSACEVVRDGRPVRPAAGEPAPRHQDTVTQAPRDDRPLAAGDTAVDARANSIESQPLPPPLEEAGPRQALPSDVPPSDAPAAQPPPPGLN